MLSLTCSDGPGDDSEANDTVLDGHAFVGGPVVDAEIVVYQIATATGLRTGERGRARTDDKGAFHVNLGGTLNSVELDVIGGSYVDVATQTTVQRGPAVLHGLALDLAIGEKRADVAVTPWSHLVYALGESRAAVPSEADRLGALKHARDLLAAHFGFDATHTGLADLTKLAPSATPEVKHALSLAGLSMSAQIAQSDGFADVTAQRFVDILDIDARSAEHLFDGNGDQLVVTAVCPPPPGCTARGPGCYASCAVSSHALRAHLGNGIRSYVRAHTATGQTAATLATWLEGIRTDPEVLLFPPGAPEPYDSIGPRIQWITPATNSATVAGSIAVEVMADDPAGVASLTVSVDNGGGPIADTDPSPARFAGTLDTTTLFDGTATLTATATDGDTNATAEPTRTVEVNNLLFGTASGLVVVSGRVSTTAVRFYRFDIGVRGAMLGEGTTGADGTFGNVRLTDGYSGPVLVEAGGSGSYREDAAPAGTQAVVLDVSDTLRTVVPDYIDGAALASVVVSPLTSFAVSYFGWLHRAPATATVVDDWTRASAAMEGQFGVANIRTIAPLPPDQMINLTAAARYGLDLVGLSQLAYRASTPGGGDAGSFPTAMNTLRVVRVLDADISDGCWDGAHNGPLSFGGTQTVTDETTRHQLADAIVAYLDDGARNQTMFGGAVDVLSLLDVLSSGGDNMAAGSCRMSGPNTVDDHIFNDNGSHFDQLDPTITISPGEGAVVGGTVMVTAVASDNLDARPTLSFLLPTGTMDLDNDMTDLDATANVVTGAHVTTEGPLVVSLESFDDATNRGTASVTWQVDNVAPTVTVGGVTDGAWYGGPVTPTVSATDTHLASFTLTLDGSPFTSGTPVGAEGRHILVATARDTVANVTARTLTFYVDRTNPTVTQTSAALPTWSHGLVDITVVADDSMKQFGSLDQDVAAVATGPAGLLTASVVTLTPMVLVGGERQLRVRIDTTVAAFGGDGPLSIAFNVTDRGAHVGTLTLSTTIDNTAPTITLNPVHNQVGAVVDGFISEQTATITGQVPTGGSPVTVTIAANPGGGTGMVAPNAAGAFLRTTTTLAAEGIVNIAASAVDAAGNSATAVPASFVVDRTGPTITLAQSSVLDERGCDVSVSVNVAVPVTDANYGNINPITYPCGNATARRLDTATATTEVGKFTNRMTSTAADNPLLWLPTANDGTGVGLDVVPSTIQFEIFRTSMLPVGNWADSIGPTTSNGLVSASLYVTAAQFPELAAYTAPFTLYIRARDRLGNVTAVPTFLTWTNRPLAPPVWIRYVGLANAADSTLGAFSLFKHSLTPSVSQVGLAGAMSSGGVQSTAVRGLYEFEVWNPHAQPINVGFFLPAFSGATYASEVLQTNPYINGTNGIVNNPPNGTCGWNAPTVSFRMTGGAAPFTCGSGTTCSCFTAGSPEPTDMSVALTSAQLTTAQLTFAAWDATPATPTRLFPQSLTTTVNGYPFSEFAVPPRPTATKASHVRVFVALPNLDLWSPAADASVDVVQESDGSGSEIHYWDNGSTRFAPVMTASFYERWADCRLTASNGLTCVAMHARRRLRATVRADVTVPTNAVVPWVRSRATMAITSDVEAIPDLPIRDGALKADHATTWTSCETAMGLPCPTIPNFTFSPPF